jgi:hypothetical protein
LAVAIDSDSSLHDKFVGMNTMIYPGNRGFCTSHCF